MKNKFRIFITVILIIYLVSSSIALADQGESNLLPIPDPLTLEQALAMADESHPDLLLAKARVEQARADLLSAEADTSFNSYLDLTAKRLKQTTDGEEVDDSFAKLVLNKTIYDFGKSSAMESSRSAYITSSELLVGDIRRQQQYEIMRRYFNVLLADFRYNVDDEEMTRWFLKYDKKRERNDLGMVSDVEVAEAENKYREALIKRVESDKNRRSARIMLGIALNRPGEVPGDLVMPQLERLESEPAGGMELYNQAIQMNPTILSIKQDVEAARSQVLAERASYYPTISAELELGDYERPTNSRGEYSAALTLRVPIYQGSTNKAKIARASARLSNHTANLKKAQQTLMVSVLTLVKKLGILKTERATARQRVTHRDLSLEYRRALYEMEVQTSMSDGQAAMTEAMWLAMKTDIDTVMTWASLHILLGKPPNTPIPEPVNAKPEETLP